MQNVETRIVESISEEVAQMQNTIRMRAYYKYLTHPSEHHMALEDWFSAENEVLRPIDSGIYLVEGETQIIAYFDIRHADPKRITVLVTSTEALVNEKPAGTRPPIFDVIRFSRKIDPAQVHVECNRGRVRMAAPIVALSTFWKDSSGIILTQRKK